MEGCLGWVTARHQASKWQVWRLLHWLEWVTVHWLGPSLERAGGLLGMVPWLGWVTAGHTPWYMSVGCWVCMEGCLGWNTACHQASKGQVCAWDGPLA